MEIQLSKFDMRMVNDDAVVVLIGKRNTGKSFLIKDLLYSKRKIPIGTVISATESANNFYNNIVPSMFIHGKFSNELVGNVMKRQQLIMKNATDCDNRAFFIMDDMMSVANQWVKSENVASMFCNGRHYGCLFILSLQYVMGIPPIFRNNVDFVFILRENIHKSRKKLYEHWAGMFPNFKMFESVMNACTQNYECIVIKNNSLSNKIEDCVFWYKAEAHEEFKTCSAKYWELDKKISHKKQREEIEAGDHHINDIDMISNEREYLEGDKYCVKKNKNNSL
jgi:hypothetical protein